eukprot:6184356-Pleurochrysis_carterae.AAC.1
MPTGMRVVRDVRACADTNARVRSRKERAHARPRTASHGSRLSAPHADRAMRTGAQPSRRRRMHAERPSSTSTPDTAAI